MCTIKFKEARSCNNNIRSVPSLSSGGTSELLVNAVSSFSLASCWLYGLPAVGLDANCPVDGLWFPRLSHEENYMLLLGSS